MNVDAAVPLQRPSRIVPLFSGASVGLTRSAPHGEPFKNLCDTGIDLDQVFVVIAEMLPGQYAVAVRENFSVAEPGSAPKGVLFSVEIDEDILVSCNAAYQCVALKLEGFACWYQLEFEFEMEYFGFLATFTQVQNSQAHRRELFQRQLISFREGFLMYFKPSVPPYDDFEEIMKLIELEEEADVEPICDSGRVDDVDEDDADGELTVSE